MHLAAILPVCRHICTNVCPGGWISTCLVARLSVWRSARSLVCSSGCIWQRVWSYINLPGNLSARRPVLEAIHLAAHSGAHSARLSIWSSAGLFYCLQAAISSICLFHRPGANPSLHLPILAGHEPILAICLLIQLQLAASGSFSNHLQAEVSSIHLPFRQAVEVHLPNLAGRGPFRSSNPSAIQAGCRPFRPKRGPIRPIYTSIHQQTHRLSRLTDSPFLHHYQANCQSISSLYILASQALQIPHICFITSPSSGNSQVPG